jgi:hypothetical protein
MTDVRDSSAGAAYAVEDTDNKQAESPKEFFEEFTKRPDVHEIFTRLARWQPSDTNRSVVDERGK